MFYFYSYILVPVIIIILITREMLKSVSFSCVHVQAQI